MSQKILYAKNLTNLEGKREKVQSELKLIGLMRPKKDTVNITLTRSGKNTIPTLDLISLKLGMIEAWKLKQMQLKTLDFLDRATPELIHETLEKEKLQLCEKCQDSLKDGDLMCRKDLLQFVFCDMMRQSLIPFVEVPEDGVAP